MAEKGHGKPDDQSRCFFAVFLPGINSDVLEIPLDFVKHTLKEVSSPAILRNSCRGGRWHINISETGNRVFFSNGWREFVEDHSLQKNDFLLFKHDGDMLFSVQIFQQNGMERLDVSVTNHEANSKKGRNQQGQRKYPLKPVKEEHNVPFQSGPGRGPSSRDYSIVQRKAKCFSSQNPFFWRLLKEYHVQNSYILNIPKSFTNDIFPKTTRTITLKNSKGEAWEVVFKVNKGGVVFTSGWKGFAQANALKAGDACILELIGETELQVHIF